MRITRPVLGKIIEHAGGLGVPSPDTVRKRAEELACIDSRTGYTDEDWKRAFHELHGGHHDGYGNDQTTEDEMQAAISERDMIAQGLGHQVGRMEIEGGHSLGEELVEEGLDEAIHDRMLEARRTIDIPEGEDLE